MKVSVIIPVYNVERYIEDCINSVLSQSFQDFEIICVEDCSTDDSCRILEEIAKKDSRIRIFKNIRNGGLSYSRNKGLEHASGEYVYFLDSDDMITKDALGALYKRACQNHLDVILFDAQAIYEDAMLERRFESYKTKREGEYESILDGQHLIEKLENYREWSSLVQRQFWRRQFLVENDLQFEVGIIHEDELFSFIAIMKAKRCEVVKEPYFIRRFRFGSIMTKEKELCNLAGDIRCYTKIMNFYIENRSEIMCNAAVEQYLNRLQRRMMILLENNPEWINEIEGKDNVEKIFLWILQQFKKPFFDGDMVERLRNSKKVVIYGAGVHARKVLEECIKLDIHIADVVVSETNGKEEKFWGYEIKEISEIVDRWDVTVIIAVRKQLIKAEMIEKARELGFYQIIVPED